MFKKILQSLSKSSAPKPAIKPAVAAKPAGKAQAEGKAGGVLQKIAKPAAAAAPPQTPEQLCGISPKASKEEVQERLKLLYRRYNRGASSLDATVRAEAEQMLDAVVAVRAMCVGLC